MKDNCLSCHAPGGSGNGIFMVGGTVFKNDLKTRYPNLTVRFYTQPNGGGELVKTLEVDAYGNFYTTGSLPFGKGLYPQVENGKGEIRSMKTWLTSGACNSCHGVSTDPININ